MASLAGCPSWDDRSTPTPPPEDEKTDTPVRTPAARGSTEPPEPTVVVAKDGSGDYETFHEAYRVSEPGDVIGLKDGRYSLDQLRTRSVGSPEITYDTVEKTGLTVVGRGRSESMLTFDTDSEILSVPFWTFWNLTVNTNDSVIGPRDGKYRGCYVTSPIMAPPGYASQEYALEEVDRTITPSSLPRPPDAETAYYGISFDRVVDAVDDLGMDNTGSSPIDDALDNALQSGTLVEFPPGTYLFGRHHAIEGLDRVGIRGTGDSRRDVQLLPTKGEDVQILTPGRSDANAGAVLVENLSFDDRSDNSTITSLFIRTTGNTVVKNVEWLGRTPRIEQGNGTDFQFGAEVTSQGGAMVCEDVYAGLDEPAVEVDYPYGVMFLHAGPYHDGEIVLRNPVIHERNSAATRVTNNSGVVTIEGGEFVNNQNANIRFGAGSHPTKVSSATGTYVEVDGSRKASDAVRLDSSDNGDAGAVLRDLTIDWSKETANGVIAIPDYGRHGRFEMYDCVVRNDGDPDDAPTVYADRKSGTADDAILVDGCSFTGSGGGFIAQQRPGSVIRDSCIDMPNASITGFDTENVSSSDCQQPSGSDPDPSPSITVTGTDDHTVELSAADSSARDGSLTSYEWNVGGATYTGETVSHTFPDAGTYTATLTVEDDDGTAATATAELVVDYARLIGN